MKLPLIIQNKEQYWSVTKEKVNPFAKAPFTEPIYKQWPSFKKWAKEHNPNYEDEYMVGGIKKQQT